MKIADSTMERLAFIRQLYQLGVEQSHQPEPANAIAILMFHDAADLLLQLASEQTNVAKKGPIYFMEYFDLLKPKVAEGGLGERPAMARLNKARDNLKHHGIRPAAADVESLRASARSFFESNVPLVFGFAFDEISMARLVALPEARQFLEASEGYSKSDDLDAAAQAIATAFAHLMRRQHQLEPTPYRGRTRMRMSTPSGGGVSSVEFDIRDLDEDVRRLSHAMETLQERVIFLSLGIEPANIERFKRIGPAITLAFDGTPHITGARRSRPLTRDDVRFSYNFVVGIALALQRRW